MHKATYFNRQQVEGNSTGCILLLSLVPRRSGQHAYQVAAALLLLLCPFALGRADGLQGTANKAADEAVYVNDADIHQPVVLQAMMNTSISTLAFSVPLFQLVPAAWTYITEETPFMLMRDFMITSTVNPATVIDYQYLAHRVALGDGQTPVTFTFQNVTLVNVRMSNNFGIDWFTTSQGSTVVLDNVLLVDTVCTASAPDTLAAVQALPQLPGHPPNTASRISELCTELEVGQRCFSDSIHYETFAAESAVEGYTFVQKNTTRLCMAYVDPECLKQHALRYCWEQQAQQVQPNQQPFSPPSGGQVTPAAAAGLAVAGVVALMVAGGLLGYWCCWRRRRGQLLQAQQELKEQQLQVFSLESTPSGARSTHSTGIQHAVVSPRSSVSGQVQLGVLLGAGSFGRCYKDRWHSNDVAVKVITCNQAELPKVLQEAEIMMKLEHEYIVRALHCIVARKQDKNSTCHHGEEPMSSSLPLRQNSSSRHSSSDKGKSMPGTAAHSSAASSLRPASTGQQQQLHQDQQLPQHSKSMSASFTSKGKLSSALRSLIPFTSAEVASAVESGAASSSMASQEVSLSAREAGGAGQVLASQGRASVEVPCTNHMDLTAGTPNGWQQQGEVEVWLVMELCLGGTLKEACSQPRDTIAMIRLVARLLEVARGMAYLHTHNCIHGDLKAANVLLKSTIYGSFGQVSKISDFGLASTLIDGATHRSTQTMGTISHSAPEVLTTGRLSPAADVYSFGIMMWELFTAGSAFKHAHFGNVVQRVVSGERPPMPAEAPEEYQLLMSHCWAADPKARPTFEQVAECLELLLENLQGMTMELAGALQGTEGQQEQQRADMGAGTASAAAKDTMTAPAAAADVYGAAPGLGHGGEQQQHQQQQWWEQQLNAGSSSGSTRRGLTVDSQHVQDL